MLIANPVDETWCTWQPICVDTSAPALALDIYESNDKYIVTTALPGGQVDHVTLHHDLLTIAGEIPEHLVENVHLLLPERVYGRFNRTVRFPKPINGYVVKANFKNGVLTVTLPKADEVQPRPTPVKAGSNGKKN